MAGQRRDLTIAREAPAALAALVVSVAVVVHLAASDRSTLLFTDGDSLITVLVTRSIAAGTPQDWAMSSVLFLPELVVFGALSLLGLPTVAALAVNGVLNLVALYAALRFVAGAVAERSASSAALAGFIAYAGLALLDSSASRESLELSSLLATTTYYAATVIGVLVTLGLILRLKGRPRLAIGIGVVALVCTVTNPIYLAWAVVPFGLLLGITRRWIALAALVGGAALGLLVRVPLSPWIANTGAGYVQPSQWAESLRYYGDLMADRLQDAAGITAVVAWGILLLAGIALNSAARMRPRVATLALVSWAAPLMIVVGSIALGTHAARYLQPAVFLAVLSAVALVSLVRVPRAVVPAVAVVLALSVVPALPQLRDQPGADVRCVTDWVEQAGRVGAGQFWSIRAPKAYAADPSSLVQVDYQLNAYAWLVNRSDFAVEHVSFLVTDEQSFDFLLPASVAGAPSETIRCGGYTIVDYGRPIVTLGPPHS